MNFQQKCLTHNLFSFSVTLLWANCFCLHIKLRFLNERGNYLANLICFGVLTLCLRNAFRPEQTLGSTVGQVTPRCWFSKARVVCMRFQISTSSLRHNTGVYTSVHGIVLFTCIANFYCFVFLMISKKEVLSLRPEKYYIQKKSRYFIESIWPLNEGFVLFYGRCFE